MADFFNFLYRLNGIRTETCLARPFSSGAKISNPARKEHRLAWISQFLACDRGLRHRTC